MANRNTVGFGLIAQGVVGSTMASQGQGKYFIDSNHGAAMFQGTVVQSKAGYIVTSEDGRTKLTIGILNGIFYNDGTTLKPTFSNHYVANTVPANSEDITAFVIDNPTQQYVCATDAAVTQAGFLETYDMNASAGSTTTGKSTSTLNIGVTGADSKSLRLLRVAEDPENDDIGSTLCSVVVCLNLIELQS